MVCQLLYSPPYTPISANKQVDGEFAAIRLADPTPEPGLHINHGMDALDAGKAIDPSHLPTKLIISGGMRAVTDFDGYRGIIFISAKMKCLIEDLEPGVHQFFPIELLNKKKQHLTDHWIWVPCNRIDSVDREHTTWILKRGQLWMTPRDFKEGELPPGYDWSRPLKMVFNATQAGNCQFWRDKYVVPGRLYCSDKAAKAIFDSGLTGIQFAEKETV